MPSRKTAIAFVAIFAAAPALAADPPNTQYPLPNSQLPAVVSHIKVLSNHVDDVSSLEAWKKSFIKDGMTEQQKALAVWRSVTTYAHHSSPPHEFLDADGGDVNDPIKDFNVYGYGLCCCQAAYVEHLARYVGLEARGWGITGHSVPEVKIDNHWSLLDASLIAWFKQPDGSIAGVEEISKSINDWLDQNHPDLKSATKHDPFYAIMRQGQWRKGPTVLAGGQTYNDNGWLPGATHAWGDTILEYKNTDKNFVYEYGTALGYQLNIQLRPGEKLTRNWSNKGLHVNMLEKPEFGLLAATPGDPKTEFRYAKDYGDLTTGRIGNGTLEYNPPLLSDQFRSGMLSAENLDSRPGTIHLNPAPPALAVKDPTKPGTLIFRMPSSYVYLSGELDLGTEVGTGGSIDISFSDNNGLDWKPLATITQSGDRKIDLKPLVYRRYDYRLKFELKGAGTGLDAVKLTHDIQHSQRPLPILVEGDNKISFSAGPQEGTITIQGNLSNNSADAKDGKNLFFNQFHPTYQSVDPKELSIIGATGSVTVPITTPGDITRLRIGANYRARDPQDKWTIQASFDEGKTFTDIGTLNGPFKGMSTSRTFDKIPPGSRSAQLRFTGVQHNATMILDLRIDADYKEPAGGFTPVQISYAWEENGQAKSDTHIAKTPEETYTIHCNTKPAMKSVALELAQ